MFFCFRAGSAGAGSAGAGSAKQLRLYHFTYHLGKGIQFLNSYIVDGMLPVRWLSESREPIKVASCQVSFK